MTWLSGLPAREARRASWSCSCFILIYHLLLTTSCSPACTVLWHGVFWPNPAQYDHSPYRVTKSPTARRSIFTRVSSLLGVVQMCFFFHCACAVRVHWDSCSRISEVCSVVLLLGLVIGSSRHLLPPLIPDISGSSGSSGSSGNAA